MPTILRHKGYRFFFFSNEGAEPPHVHVGRGDEVAKLCSTLVALAWKRGFRAPSARFPRLLGATFQQRSHWRIIGHGIGVHGPLPDEDISVAGLLAPHKRKPHRRAGTRPRGQCPAVVEPFLVARRPTES
ncbi:MAG TPA: DUF2442 domain-containing protein [Terriglobales bacterium]|nr:DUF2442 domain-containing protein [Terriglobales bacterium]